MNYDDDDNDYDNNSNNNNDNNNNNNNNDDDDNNNNDISSPPWSTLRNTSTLMLACSNRLWTSTLRKAYLPTLSGKCLGFAAAVTVFWLATSLMNIYYLSYRVELRIRRYTKKKAIITTWIILTVLCFK